MKKRFGFLILSVLVSYSAVSYAQDNEQAQKRYFDINKNVEIFNSVVKELDMFYVDSVDIQKTIESGIVNMLAGLDPYTNYLNESEMVDFKFQTTGEYAGIGSIISYRNIDGRDMVIVLEPYENMPAAKSGLKTGDIILAIDGEDMTQAEKVPGEAYGKTLSTKATNKLKGQAGTEITVKVERPGVKKPIDIKIVRENIQVSSVPYYGLLDNNVGYIVLTGFIDKSAQSVKNAILDLKKQGATSLILDLRGNGGGIMEEAIQIVNFFVPKGQVVLSTKGKVKQWDRTSRTTLEPIDTEIPLVVLVDRGSASASEIVSGAIQDLDRGAIMGQRTYGKGLVQTPRDLPYGGSLKVTTSKYYIPSGRCIQAIDYTHRNEDGSVGRIPDSLTTVFKTSIGREVRDGGGVVPDIKLEEDKTPSMTYYLINEFIISDWVTDWLLKNPKNLAIGDINISDSDYENFKEFVKSKKDFKYDGISEKRLKSLKTIMDFEGYSDTAGEEYKALEAKLVPNLERDLDSFKENIIKLINIDIAKRHYYQRGENMINLRSDKDVKAAVELLSNQEKYKEIFTPGRKIEDTDKTGSEEEGA